jgi:hypothetical protein
VRAELVEEGRVSDDRQDIAKPLVFAGLRSQSFLYALLRSGAVNKDTSASLTSSTETADSHVEVHLVATADTRAWDVPSVWLISVRSSGNHRDDDELKKCTTRCDLAMTAEWWDAVK